MTKRKLVRSLQHRIGRTYLAKQRQKFGFTIDYRSKVKVKTNLEGTAKTTAANHLFLVNYK